MSIQTYKTAVTVTSATLADLGSGLLTGHVRIEPDGRHYVLLYCGVATLLDGEWVTVDATESTATVIHADRGTDLLVCLGLNNTGDTVEDNTYFWALKNGVGYAQANGTHLLGAILEATADGEVDTGTIGGTNHIIGVALEAGTAGNNHEVYISV